MTHALLLVFMFMLAGRQALPAPGDDLGVVRAHYAAAAYEDALTHLAALDAERITPALEQYRALCLLALGRFQDGEAAFERLVRQAPRFVIPDGDVAPRLLVVFREVRRRVLPAIAREAYDRGKDHFDAGAFADAIRELRRIEPLLDDPDLEAAGDEHADLRQLAEGFLQLAELAAGHDVVPPARDTQAAVGATPTRASGAPTAPPPTAPPAATPAVVASSGSGHVYSAIDADVTPPTVESRAMPAWDPPAVMARYLEYRGEIDVVVDERGRVLEAEVTRRTIPSYDARLIDATESWRFQPARRTGTPVKYRLSYEFVLAPTR